jgi:tRNA-uridine 2-sulfurtransferase
MILTKAIAMFSGGKDSMLAIKSMQAQGVDILAVNFVMPFELSLAENLEVRKRADQIGVEFLTESRGDSFIEMVKHPKFGFGANVNPCIDCRIRSFRRCRELMDEHGAQFIVTGEVLGQRPMSQRREAMNQIDKESGMKGLVLRPLSAKQMEPTLPELEGWVDREKLHDISGRSRKGQSELAAAFGLTDMPGSGGGCVLTDPIFGRKLKHLWEMKPEETMADWTMLLVGRHLVLGPNTKAIISRNESENEHLAQLAQHADCFLEPDEWPGPSALIIGPHGEAELKWVGEVILRYSNRNTEPPVNVTYEKGEKKSIMVVGHRADDDSVAQKLLC